MALVGSFSTSPPAVRRIARVIVGRNKGVSMQSRLEQANRLAEWTLHAPDARAMATAELAALPDSKNVFVAAGLVAEAAVVDWLARRNLTGVAVSTAPGLRKLRELWPAAGRQRRFLQFFIRLRHSRTHVRNWALRFRRRWGLRWARLPARADLPEERCVRRVGALFFRPEKWETQRQFGGPKTGPFFGPIFSPSLVEYVGRGAKNGSIFWTHFWPPGCVPRRPQPIRVSAEAAIFLQWTRWVRHQVPADAAVVVNFDETALERQIARRYGIVVSVGRAWQDLAMH
jgi:hypothetical protein